MNERYQTIYDIDLRDAPRQELKRIPYREFLKTPFWDVVRREVRERAGGICQMCGDKRQRNLQAHHRTYEHHGWEDQYLEDLIALCDECHEDVERHPERLRAWPYHPVGDRRDNGVAE